MYSLCRKQADNQDPDTVFVSADFLWLFSSHEKDEYFCAKGNELTKTTTATYSLCCKQADNQAGPW